MMRRFDMRLPAVVRLDGAGDFHTETQNVSARGVFLYLDRALEPGSQLEVTLTFPPHITLTDPVRVRFTARVIRVESPLPSLRIGTAALIENYEFLRSGGAGINSPHVRRNPEGHHGIAAFLEPTHARRVARACPAGRNHRQSRRPVADGRWRCGDRDRREGLAILAR